MTEHQKQHPLVHRMEADGSCDEIVLGAFDRNGVAENSRSVKASEVEKIGRRLNILEEDTKAMKKALFDNLEESRNLVYEINQQFQSINKSHCDKASAAAFMASLQDYDDTLNPPKEWRGGVGLSEIFHHQPNLSLVFKHFKPNLLAFTDSSNSLDHVRNNI